MCLCSECHFYLIQSFVPVKKKKVVPRFFGSSWGRFGPQAQFMSLPRGSAAEKKQLAPTRLQAAKTPTRPQAAKSRVAEATVGVRRASYLLKRSSLTQAGSQHRKNRDVSRSMPRTTPAAPARPLGRRRTDLEPASYSPLSSFKPVPRRSALSPTSERRVAEALQHGRKIETVLERAPNRLDLKSTVVAQESAGTVVLVEQFVPESEALCMEQIARYKVRNAYLNVQPENATSALTGPFELPSLLRSPWPPRAPQSQPMEKQGYKCIYMNKQGDQSNTQINCGIRSLLWILFVDKYGIRQASKI